MELTGNAGMLVGWCIMVTAYAIFFLGLFYIWHWIIDHLFKRVLIYLSLYEKIILWIYHMAEFKRWRKENKTEIK